MTKKERKEEATYQALIVLVAMSRLVYLGSQIRLYLVPNEAGEYVVCIPLGCDNAYLKRIADSLTNTGVDWYIWPTAGQVRESCIHLYLSARTAARVLNDLDLIASAEMV